MTGSLSKRKRGGGPLGALHAAFHVPSARSYRIVDGIVWVLIALSVCVFIAELVIVHGGGDPGWLETVDRIILWCFVAELALRVLTYRPRALDMFDGGIGWKIRQHVLGRLRFLFTPLILVDLMAVIALAPGLRGLRALRLLRVVRSTRLLRYSSPFQGILRSFQENALLYATTFGFLLAVVNLGGVSFFLVEGPVNEEVNSIGDGLWWAVVTLTTVGFGDITPQTSLGRVVAMGIMVMGMFTLALFAALVGSTLLRVLVQLRQDQFRMSFYSDHVVVCGYDSSSRLLLDTLLDELDRSETEIVVFGEGERPADLPPEFLWLSGDPTKESELDKVRMSHARIAIVAGGRHLSPQQADARTLLIIFTIRSFLASAERRNRSKPLYIICEILDPENIQHARTAGADEIIETTRLGFSLVAHAAVEPGTGTIMSQVASAEAHSIYGDTNPIGEKVEFGVLLERARKEHGVLVLGVRDPETGKVHLNPAEGFDVAADWEILYLSTDHL